MGGADRLFGDGGADTLRGGRSEDRLDGGAGNDVLRGQAGADTLNGGGGDDRLEGGRQNDFLKGGSGADVFFFGINSFGQDSIADFEDGQDLIEIAGRAFEELNIEDVNGDALITVGSGSIRLLDVSADLLTAEDFDLSSEGELGL